MTADSHMMSVIVDSSYSGARKYSVTYFMCAHSVCVNKLRLQV